MKRRQGAKSGWILAEALAAALVAALSLTTAVLIVRDLHKAQREAVRNASAVLLAERLLEESRSADAPSARSGQSTDGFSWTVETSRHTPRSDAWPGLRRIQVRVTWSDGGGVRTTELDTLAAPQ